MKPVLARIDRPLAGAILAAVVLLLIAVPLGLPAWLLLPLPIPLAVFPLAGWFVRRADARYARQAIARRPRVGAAWPTRAVPLG